MSLTAVTEDGVCVVEGTPGQAILRRPQDEHLSRLLEILSDDLRMFETRAEARLWFGSTAQKTPT